jgi:hypothetical protein
MLSILLFSVWIRFFQVKGKGAMTTYWVGKSQTACSDDHDNSPMFTSAKDGNAISSFSKRRNSLDNQRNTNFPPKQETRLEIELQDQYKTGGINPALSSSSSSIAGHGADNDLVSPSVTAVKLAASLPAEPSPGFSPGLRLVES